VALRSGRAIGLAQGYGLSETTITALAGPVIAAFGPSHLPTRPPRGQAAYTAIFLAAGMEPLLLDDMGHSVRSYEPGELWLRGPTIASGYCNNPVTSKEVFGLEVEGVGGEWMRTGDRFCLDMDGYFYFVDRIKNVFKVSGVQVSPTEIEETIRAHCGSLLLDICVAGVPLFPSTGHHDFRISGEHVPRAWAVLADPAIANQTEMRKCIESAVERHLSRQKWLVGGVEFVDQIPKIETGKVLRRVLQEWHSRDCVVSATM